MAARTGWLIGVWMLMQATSAIAGRSPFSWSFGTEVNPTRMVEVETWISEENKKGDAETDSTSIWWGVVVGLTDHLELAIPIEVAYEAAGGSGSTQLDRWGGELRYRFDSPDPEQAGSLTSLVRAAIKRTVTERAGFRAEADVVNAFEHGRVLALVDVGLVIKHAPGETKVELTPGAGVNVRAAGDLRLGVESFAEVQLDNDDPDWLVIGPAASFTHGRFWISGTYGIGVFGIRTAPRIKLGISF